MNIIIRELRAHMKGLIIWCLCIYGFVALMMTEFSAYYNNPEMSDILDAVPEALLEAFAMNNANLTTVSGFVSIASVYFYIMLGIYGAIIGSSIIAKEERDKTAEFLMVLPISRQKIIISKTISAIICCLVVNLATALSVYISTAKYDKVIDFNQFMVLMMLGIFMLQLIFMSVGMLFAAIMKRYKKSGVYAISLVIGLYIVSIFAALSDKMEDLKYITPFKYFEANYIINEGKLEGVYILLAICIVGISVIGTYVVYPRRDLHV